MNYPNFYLLFDHIEIQAANTISSPITYGFPALTGFTGTIHALSRKLFSQQVELGGVMIACHDYQILGYKNSDFSDLTFNQTRNPLKKNGDSPSIIEEGKIHLDISLVVEMEVKDPELYYALNSQDSEQKTQFLEHCKKLLMQQRIAGGSVFQIENVELFNLSEESEIKLALMPAFVLMDAKQILADITQSLQNGISNNEITIYPATPNANVLDALLEVATLHHIPLSENATSQEWETFNVNQGKGWLVPIPVGYQAISPLFTAGEMQNCRVTEYPSQYVETVYSLGKWVFPFSLPDDLSQCFWHYNTPQDNLYLITQGA
ncbi:CRISPR-associated protein [Actinobacillus lignieresii]|uniref:type I-F CRISPR-associated protein Csy2 n=1 Tax=Actinobacillus lignieresii TaxID=720 RepID=UPI000F711E07|nr:type I-F CRISPR-associated protein Csy2 [Actinobacillus lignieresii]VEB26587.1 CRISPR-associated protein [Actinobacillus lignieresii]